jgi:hypothetical protein
MFWKVADRLPVAGQRTARRIIDGSALTRHLPQNIKETKKALLPKYQENKKDLTYINNNSIIYAPK